MDLVLTPKYKLIYAKPNPGLIFGEGTALKSSQFNNSVHHGSDKSGLPPRLFLPMMTIQQSTSSRPTAIHIAVYNADEVKRNIVIEGNANSNI